MTRTDAELPERYERLQLTRTQRVALGAAGFLLLATVLTGPYLVAVQSHQAATQLKEIKAGVAGTQRSDADIQRVLDFIASVQNGPQAKAARTSTVWYVEQFENICKATAGCVPVPLPDSLKSQLPPDSSTTTVPPGG